MIPLLPALLWVLLVVSIIATGMRRLDALLGVLLIVILIVLLFLTGGIRL